MRDYSDVSALQTLEETEEWFNCECINMQILSCASGMHGRPKTDLGIPQ